MNLFKYSQIIQKSPNHFATCKPEGFQNNWHTFLPCWHGHRLTGGQTLDMVQYVAFLSNTAAQCFHFCKCTTIYCFQCCKSKMNYVQTLLFWFCLYSNPKKKKKLPYLSMLQTNLLFIVVQKWLTDKTCISPDSGSIVARWVKPAAGAANREK